MTSNSPKHIYAISFGLNPVPTPQYMKQKSRADRAEFPPDVREKIIDFFRGKCAICKERGTQIHHIRFRSQSGRGVFTNGLLLCNACHVALHKDDAIAFKWQCWAEKRYGVNYYKDEYDLKGEKPLIKPNRRKNKKGPKKKKPKKPAVKKKWPKKKLPSRKMS